MPSTWKRIAAVAVVSAAAIMGAALAQELRVPEGKWEITTNMTMTMNVHGQAIAIPPQKLASTKCMTAEDSRFSPEDLTREGCTVSNLVSTPNSMAFDVACSQQGIAMTGKTSFRLNDARTEGTGSVSMQGNGSGMTMSASGSTTAKRVGAC